MYNRICKTCGAKKVNVTRTYCECKTCNEIRLNKNFECVNSKYWLIQSVFNKNSEFSVNMYVKHFIAYEGINNWIDVLKHYGRYNEFIIQLSELFYLFNKKNKSVSVSLFAKKIHVDARHLYGVMGDKFFSDLGIKKPNKKNSTISDLHADFKNTTTRLGYVPLYSEYFNESKYSVAMYEKTIKGKDISMYDWMVRENSEEDIFCDYINRKLERKREIFYNNNIASTDKYTLDELSLNLKKIFDSFYLENGDYPSRRSFDKLSSIDSKTYRTYYSKSWLDIANENGYEIDRSMKSEKECLAIISKLLNENYKSQKTWNWLRSDKEALMFCDGYFNKANLVVEYMGAQHRNVVEHWGSTKGLRDRIKRDEIKKSLVVSHGINYLAIWFDDDWRNENFLKEKLREVINHA